MPRRKSATSIIKAIAREQARAQREREKYERALERERIHQEKIAEQEYQSARAEDVEQMNLDLKDTIIQLQSVLEQTLRVDDTISFNNLRLNDKFRKPPEKKDFLVKKPSFAEGLIPGSKGRYQEKLKEAKRKYLEAVEQ